MIATTHKAFFVIGSDTGVGKTIVTAGLARSMIAHGIKAAAMKPVASGVIPPHYLQGQTEAFWEDEAFLNIADCHAMDTDERLVYKLKMAASPHFAAAAEGVTLSPDRLMMGINFQRAKHEMLIIEGVGGLRVPLNMQGYDLGLLIRALDLPVILVVGMRLGCINHALLTIESLINCGIPIAGWVANAGIDAGYGLVNETIRSIEEISHIPCSAVLPLLSFGSTNPSSLSGYFDSIEERVSKSSEHLSGFVARLLTEL